MVDGGVSTRSAMRRNSVAMNSHSRQCSGGGGKKLQQAYNQHRHHQSLFINIVIIARLQRTTVTFWLTALKQAPACLKPPPTPTHPRYADHRSEQTVLKQTGTIDLGATLHRNRQSNSTEMLTSTRQAPRNRNKKRGERR